MFGELCDEEPSGAEVVNKLSDILTYVLTYVFMSEVLEWN